MTEYFEGGKRVVIDNIAGQASGFFFWWFNMNVWQNTTLKFTQHATDGVDFFIDFTTNWKKFHIRDKDLLEKN